LRHLRFTAAPWEIYDIWPRRNPAPVENQPVHNRVPALVLCGELDPDTPVHFAESVARNLPNSHLLVFKGRSHLQIFTKPTGYMIVRAFLNNPRVKPEVKEGLLID
jgi:pimeloyl-ACP methyl ester carboxylesterase